MRLKVSRSKNSASLYVTKTVYVDKKVRTFLHSTKAHKTFDIKGL